MNFAVIDIEQEQISDYRSELVNGSYVKNCHQIEVSPVSDDVSIQSLLICLQNIFGANWNDQHQIIQWLSLYAFENYKNIGFPSINSPEDYYSILSGILLPKQFERTDMYLDRFNGCVVDFFLSEERITCIVSAEEIQVLSFLNREFKEQIFERTKQAKVEIEAYVISLFDSSNS